MPVHCSLHWRNDKDNHPRRGLKVRERTKEFGLRLYAEGCWFSVMPADQPLTHWDTDPRLVRGLAFLRAHAVTLRTRQKLR